ncbi:hypothetical protein [Actinophytocola sp. NPDC049390]|uniref:hypothetical protein n=1 Tax=Actinophytocola sp. NPDC049390 TaxID=3363894 RepID=UPI0037B3645D
MATRLPNASQQAAADGVVDRTDTGTGTATGLLRIYTGAQPADADTAASGTLLAECTLANPAFGAANASGTATLLSVPRTTTGLATGTAGWFRVVNRDGASVYDGLVSMSGGGGELILDNTSIASGQTVNITGLTYTQPA